MNISYRTEYILRDIFNYHAEDTYVSSRLSLDNNDIFNHDIIVNIKDDKFEVPIIALSHIENIIRGNLNDKLAMKCDKIIIPLYKNSNSKNCKTFNTIIGNIFSATFNDRLRQITTGKGYVYYGGRGIILDRDYTPLLLITLKGKIITNDDNTIGFKYIRPICHINPIIFNDKTNVINKGIINTIITYYSNNSIQFIDGINTRTSHINDKKVRVIIDNFDNFFITPNRPTPSTCSDEILNDCLVNNIKELQYLI